MIRIPLFILALACSVPARAAASAYDEDWTAFGQVLTLVETMVHAGMQPNPDAAIADVLTGRNPQANGAIAGLFAGVTAEMPPEYRDRVASLGRDLAGYVANHPVVAAVDQMSAERALQARKDLNAMGLRYYDEKQFLDAAKRNDTLAVQLFVAGRGVNLGATTWDGRTALDIARDNKNAQLADLLSRSLPSKR
ncbi:MAG TPA: hypothetical protein VE935_11965 [Burkholderiales bacterium]|nr:hypothetical protein [Burkholderiales bacterium]